MMPSIEDLRQMVTPEGVPQNVKQIAYMELEQLSGMPPGTDEYKSRIKYTAFVLGLPWNKRTEDEQDVRKIESVMLEAADCSQEVITALVKHISEETGKARILVVDDEKVALDSIVYTLKKDGYDVVPAKNGASAIDKLSEAHYDVVITDLIMDDIDGRGVLNEIRNKHKSTKAIMVTGYATVDTAVDAMRMGAFHYIEKPLSLEELRHVVKDALKEKFFATRRALCLAGKNAETCLSIAAVTAKSLGRKMLSIPLSEISGASDITGRSRKYEGAGPGRFIKEISAAGVNNPVIMIEGLDKAGNDLVPGLMELLDNRRNNTFRDLYVEIPFDMSNIIFVATADDAHSIDPALSEVLDIIAV